MSGGTKKDDRAVCVSRLVARLTGRAWTASQKFDIDKNDAEETDVDSKLPRGVAELLDYLRTSRGILEVEDAGKHMENILTGTGRRRGTAMGGFHHAV